MFCTANRFSCSPCDLKFANEEQFQKYMKNKHADRSVKRKLECTECDYSCDFNSDYQRHFLKHSKVKAHKCDTCGKCFTQKCNLTRHIKSVHTKELQVKCKICENFFVKVVFYFNMLKLFVTRFDILFVLNVIKHFLKIVYLQST